VWHETTLEAHAAGLELVGSSGILAVNETHKLRRGVPMVVRRSVLEGSIRSKIDHIKGHDSRYGSQHPILARK
jgi:hypothetical protein